MDFLNDHHLTGLLIGLATFFVIGLFHPLVIKAEYHLGTRCWWMFLALGVALLVLSILSSNVLLQAVLGVAGFSSFWSILEVFHQQERVRKGWFPRNPRRHYPFDNKE